MDTVAYTRWRALRARHPMLSKRGLRRQLAIERAAARQRRIHRRARAAR